LARNGTTLAMTAIGKVWRGS